MGLTKEQLICDVLDQYEAHLVFLEAQTELAAPSQINASGASKTHWESDFETTPKEEA